MTRMYAECHAHLALDGVSFAGAKNRNHDAPDEAAMRCALEAYRSRGITFVRDGGDAWGVSKLVKGIAAEYGIDYRSPLFAIHKEGTYGTIVGYPFTTMSEYAALVDRADSEGADFIKIMTTGIMDFSSFGAIVGGTGLPLDELREMVGIAHAHGLAVMSHTNGTRAMLDAVQAGVDSIEHGNYVDGECIAALAESRTCLVPTATVARNAIGRGIGDDTVLRAIYERSLEAIASAAAAGVILACGSDAGAVGVPHGQGFFDERDCFIAALGSEEAADAVIERGAAFIMDTFQRT